MLHLTVSNKQHPGLDLLLASTSLLSNVQTRVLGIGNGTPIGHGGAGFGLKLQLLQQELKLLPPLQPVLFTDAWDVLLQGSVDPLLEWLKDNEGKVLFAAETTKWPNKDLLYPVPLTFPFPYLNSGVFMGRAKDILSLLEKPFDAKTDDQGYYSEQFVLASNDKIVLDHEAKYFLCMHGIDKHDVHIVKGTLVYKDKVPKVIHLNNGYTRMKWFPFVARGVLGGQYVEKAKTIVYESLFSAVKQARFHIFIVLLLLFVYWIRFFFLKK
jgi:hypothetical protein